jgi:large subunit ribosomal protein L2
MSAVIVKRFKSTRSPGSRHKVLIQSAALHKGKPHKSLTRGKKSKAGRNNLGRITTRHRGGGVKQSLRQVDFKRQKDEIPATVATIEYDPNRTAYIALVVYADGHKAYIIAPNQLKVGDKVESGPHAEIKIGNSLPLRNIPLGSTIHCIEMKPLKGAQMVRSAGGFAQLVAKEGLYVTVRLRSGETRKVLAECRATIGVVSNSEHNLICLGKAGASRHRGIRPTVRGVAMNPVDHPHGGGEGRTSGGRHPVSPWGVATKGYKTRRNKVTSKYIVSRRKSKKRGRN